MPFLPPAPDAPRAHADARHLPCSADLLGRLRAAVGEDHVLTDPTVVAAYEVDWTGRFTGRTPAVVRPGSTAEVAAVLRACAEHGRPVVVAGGRTGLVGGCVPSAEPGGEVVLSTARLTAREPVDAATGTVVVGAGTPLAALQSHAAAAGWSYGVDFAARGSATVGGTVATNAGGLRVVRYGDTRAQVRGVEAVLADGSVVERLTPPAKDSTGYDVTGLLVGSEGTLGVLTRLRVRLVPPERAGEVVMVGCRSVGDALRLLPRDRRSLRAAELVTEAGVRLVGEALGMAQPLRTSWPFYVLLEAVPDVPVDELLAGAPDDVDAAVDPRLWDYRERQTEAVATAGTPHKLDVCLPLGRLADFVETLPALVTPHRLVLFGHLAEGNLHVNVLGPDPDDDEVDRRVLEAVAARGGSIAAEHGIGRAKAHHLGLSRSPAEVAAMRAVKDALDPQGLLGPGVLLPRRQP